MLEVPAWVAENLAKEQFIDERLEFVQGFDRLLKDRHPNLSLTFVKDTEAARSAKLEPGRWHFKRHNPGTVDSYMPIVTPTGGYREPTLRDLEELDRRDLWRRPYAVVDLMAQEARQRDKAEKDAALRREQLRDHALEDIRAGRRVAGEDLDRRRWGAGRK
jgi:hypothetical protein